ncbi:MAG: hypothetical protein LC768_08055 [Acidobacteria bacterium]|nr:hypothetical protein [Acidobacteriota bacterium]
MKRPKNNCRILPFRGEAFLFLICAVFAPLSIAAKTLAEYQKNLQDAGKSTIELLYPNDEDVANKNYPQFERRIVGEIRAKIPVSEKIEWKGAEIETNNQWLDERLNEFEKETKNPLKRAEILNEISERLSALEQKINELENPSVAERSKDENKQKLAEILRLAAEKRRRKKRALFWASNFRQMKLPKTFLPKLRI